MNYRMRANNQKVHLGTDGGSLKSLIKSCLDSSPRLAVKAGKPLTHRAFLQVMLQFVALKSHLKIGQII